MSKKELQLQLKSQPPKPSQWLPLLPRPIPSNLRLPQLRPQTPEEIEKEKKEKEELLVRRQKMLLQLADGGAQENDDMDFNEGEIMDNISCIVNGKPDPTFMWSKDGMQRTQVIQ